MNPKRLAVLIVVILVFACTAWLLWGGVNRAGAADDQPEIYASPINGGCYISEPGVCKIHIEPLAININTTIPTRLELFRVVLNPSGGSSSIIYDFATDISNPPPTSGSVYYPSQVALDFAARCGVTYTVSLQGKDSRDSVIYVLGSTRQFTCPSVVP